MHQRTDLRLARRPPVAPAERAYYDDEDAKHAEVEADADERYYTDDRADKDDYYIRYVTSPSDDEESDSDDGKSVKTHRRHLVRAVPT